VNASVPARSKQSAEVRGGPAKFPPSARLLRHSDFECVYKQGRRHFSASLTVFYRLRRAAKSGNSDAVGAKPGNRDSGLRVGFTVGRALGGAVERNRMKRRLREAVRLSWPEHPANIDIVINPKKSVLKVDFEALLTEVRRAFAVIEQKLGTAPDLGGSASAEQE
jgi:ribonuclease P protein component